jgi:hypothetical protein
VFYPVVEGIMSISRPYNLVPRAEYEDKPLNTPKAPQLMATDSQLVVDN